MRNKTFLSPLLAFLITALLLFALCSKVSAHPGRTDSNGGHSDQSTGEYHYHHGYSAHSHYDMDGDGDVDCPYDFDDQTNHHSNNSSNSNNRVNQSESNLIRYEDKKNTISTSAEPAPITFMDVLNALLSSLLPALALLVSVSYFSFYIFSIFFGENKGCSVAIIFGVIISIIAYIWFIILKLT